MDFWTTICMTLAELSALGFLIHVYLALKTNVQLARKENRSVALQAFLGILIFLISLVLLAGVPLFTPFLLHLIGDARGAQSFFLLAAAFFLFLNWFFSGFWKDNLKALNERDDPKPIIQKEK